MQCFTHVLCSLLLTMALISTVEANTVFVDEVYCDGLALMAKATAEARQRSEPIEQWRKNLNTQKRYGVKDKDNVLYYVLPQAINDINSVYKNRKSPFDTYMTSYKQCMVSQYGKSLIVN